MRGKVSIGAMLFYISSFLVLLSVPYTVYLLRVGQEQITGASSPTDSFSSPPSFEIIGNPTTINPLDNISISVKNNESNLYLVYFSDEDPFLLLAKMQRIIRKNDFVSVDSIVYQGENPTTFSYSPSKSGNILAAVFQLKNPLEDFNSGDTMCTWDGSLFIFRKRENIFSNLLQKDSQENGFWERLTVCNHSGPISVTVN